MLAYRPMVVLRRQRYSRDFAELESHSKLGFRCARCSGGFMGNTPRRLRQVRIWQSSSLEMLREELGASTRVFVVSC